MLYEMERRSVIVRGKRLSIHIERAFWTILKEISQQKKKSIPSIIAMINERRGDANLLSALRVYILEESLSLISEQPDKRLFQHMHLGIKVLETMCHSAGLRLGKLKCAELLKDIENSFSHERSNAT